MCKHSFSGNASPLVLSLPRRFTNKHTPPAVLDRTVSGPGVGSDRLCSAFNCYKTHPSIIQALFHFSVCLCCLPPSHPWHASFTLSLQNRIYEHLSRGYVQRARFPKQTNSSFPPPWAQIIRENVAHPVPAIILAPYSVCLCARHVVYTPYNI